MFRSFIFLQYFSLLLVNNIYGQSQRKYDLEEINDQIESQKLNIRDSSENRKKSFYEVFPNIVNRKNQSKRRGNEIKRITNASDTVVVAEIIGEQTFISQYGIPIRLFTATVEDSLKNDVLGDIGFLLVGGTDGLGRDVLPSHGGRGFEIGDREILFLKNSAHGPFVFNLVQSFSIHKNKIYSEYGYPIIFKGNRVFKSKNRNMNKRFTKKRIGQTIVGDKFLRKKTFTKSNQKAINLKKFVEIISYYSSGPQKIQKRVKKNERSIK